MPGGFLGRVHDRCKLWNTDAGNDAGGADGTRADADLYAIRARADQRPGRLGGRDIAGDHLNMVGQFLDRFDRGRHLLAMAMRSVDDDEVAFRIDQRLAALQTGFTHGGGGSDAQAARRVLRGLRIGDGFFDILDGDEANAVIGLVHNEQLFDPALVQQPLRLVLADAGLDGSEIILRHQFADQLSRIFSEPHVAMGEDADQLARFLDHRNAADLVPLHQHLRVGERSGRQDGDGIDDHAAFEPLHRPDGIGLFLDRQIAVQHANPAQLRHDDRHVGFRHRIHGRRQDRDVKLYPARDLRAGIGLARQHIGFGGLQQHVVKGEAKADVHVKATFCCGTAGAPHGDSWRPM